MYALGIEEERSGGVHIGVYGVHIDVHQRCNFVSRNSTQYQANNSGVIMVLANLAVPIAKFLYG
jgi:hypothetical protein